MFSGIIKKLEKPIKIEKEASSMRITLKIPDGWTVEKGESISLDGTCLTVESKTNNSFSVFLMEETLSKTTFPLLNKNHRFNLEKPLTLNTLIGGHLVSGHIDTIDKVIDIKNSGETKILTFQLPKKFIKYLVYKGSIAINGVSLTVAAVRSGQFTVSLIPYTLKYTNLGDLKINDKVNIEADLVSKYLEKLIK